jgi:tRNA modification GTPase
MNTSTIAACSTGAMPCAIAAVRLSGPLAKEIADGIFRVKGDIPFSARKARTMHYGKFYAKDGALLDFGLAVLFPAPGSYTGEDLVEFYPHGSQAVVSALLDHCFALGAIPAPPGEYTKRAFLNNRLDLTEAEAVGHSGRCDTGLITRRRTSVRARWIFAAFCRSRARRL